MRRLAPVAAAVVVAAAAALAQPRPRPRIRSATSPSTTTPGSSSPATACSSTTSSTSPRSRRSSRATACAHPATRPRSCAISSSRSTASGPRYDRSHTGSRSARGPAASRRFASRPCTLRPLHGTALAFADRTFVSRIGWREITLRARDGARIVSSSVPSTSRSDELRAYPRDLLRSPLDVRSATARFVAGHETAAAPRLGPSVAPHHVGGGFEALIDRGRPDGRCRPRLSAGRRVLGCRARA